MRRIDELIPVLLASIERGEQRQFNRIEQYHYEIMISEGLIVRMPDGTGYSLTDAGRAVLNPTMPDETPAQQYPARTFAGRFFGDSTGTQIAKD